MQRIHRLFVLVLLFGGILLARLLTARPASAQSEPAVRVAVKTIGPLTQSTVDALSQYGRINRRMWSIGILDMQVSRESLPSLAADPRVQYVEEDRHVKLLADDSLSSGLSIWNLDIINVTDTALNPPGLWDPAAPRSVAYDGAGVYVAVLDEGLVHNWREYFPEDRIDQIHATAFTGGQAGFGETDHGVAAVTDRRWENATHPHGTAVTSVIIGYRFTEIGQAFGDPGLPPLITNGVAPKATIIPIKVTQNGPNSGSSASVLDLVAAIYYVGKLRETGEITRPIVINMSVSTGDGTPGVGTDAGGEGPSPSTEAAINYAISHGVIVVAAAGNQGTAGMSWPAAYPQVISAGMTGWKDEFIAPTWVLFDVPEANGTQSFVVNNSSRELPGQQLDLVAPGRAVFVPWVDNGTASPPAFRAKILNFAFVQGSSFASPHAAGVAALVMQKNGSLTQAQVEAILKSTALPIVPGSFLDANGNLNVWGGSVQDQGSGLLQADAALAATPP